MKKALLSLSLLFLLLPQGKAGNRAVCDSTAFQNTYFSITRTHAKLEFTIPDHPVFTYNEATGQLEVTDESGTLFIVVY